jgi:hypothetical protein
MPLVPPPVWLQALAAQLEVLKDAVQEVGSSEALQSRPAYSLPYDLTSFLSP